MPTTTAAITLSSADLTGDALALSTTSTLTKGGTTSGLDQTTGVGRKTYKQNTIDTLIAATDYSTGNKAHKVYLKNTSTVATEYIVLTVNSQEIGRLYAGDWTLLPWTAAASADIKVTPSVATALTVEYAVIFEE